MTMKNNSPLSCLGLAMRAGKLVTGDELVLQAIRSGKAKLVVVAADASPRTQKKFRDKCSHYQIPLVECGSRYELGASIGKKERVIVAVNDPGFAAMIAKCQAKPAEVEEVDETRQ